jgi:hypothetical protein
VGPTVRGADNIADLLAASRDAHEALERAFSDALAANPDASDAELAALAVEGARSPSWFDGVATADVVRGGHRALPSYVRAARAARNAGA